MTDPGAYDGSLSALRDHVDGLGVSIAIWENRRESDAHARRCASDAVGAIDVALGELYRVRAQLVSEIRKSDDQAAARADALLGRPRGDQR